MIIIIILDNAAAWKYKARHMREQERMLLWQSKRQEDCDAEINSLGQA